MPVVEARALTADEEAVILDELWSRRLRTQTLRLRGFTQTQIAVALSVDQSTVSRDLVWIREHRKEQFGPAWNFNAAEEIGEAVALFRDAEMSALRDYARTPMANIRDRVQSLKLAMFARLSRLNTLQDAGYMERHMGTLGVLIRADAVRETLMKEGLMLEGGRPANTAMDTDVDPVDAWLQRVS